MLCLFKFQLTDELLEIIGKQEMTGGAIDALARINSEPGEDNSMILCNVGGLEVWMKIDSGSGFNTLSEETWKKLETEFNEGKVDVVIYPVSGAVKAFAYASSAPLNVIKRIRAKTSAVHLHKPHVDAEYIVVQGANKSLLGCRTATEMNVLRMGGEVLSIVEIREEASTKKFPIAPYPEIEFDINYAIRPSKQYFSRIPEAFESKVDDRVEEMLQSDIIEVAPEDSEWLSGLNVVPKGSDDFRLVLNMRRANQAIRRPYIRIPTLEDIRASIRGSKFFSKIDLKQAFFHLVLAEKSRGMTTFRTRKGTFRYKRMVFGVSSAPETFQDFMSFVLKGIKGEAHFIDDILMHAASLEQLREITRQVEQRLSEFNLVVNKDKSESEKETITFLGHRISGEGINIDEEKIKVIEAFRAPKDIVELKAFLGLAGFVAPYMERFADLVEPLRAVVRSAKRFAWGAEQEAAFKAVKDQIAHCTTTLGAFDPDLPVIVYTDASGVALGAVLTQPKPDGTNVIVSCAAHTLNETERRYDQTNREALAIVWALEHFQYYLLGRNFRVRTDSLGAIGALTKTDRSTSKCVMRRIDGYKSRLEMFGVTYEHVPGTENIADPASRLSQGSGGESAAVFREVEIAQIEAEFAHINFDPSILTEEEVREMSIEDETTQKVIRALETGEWTAELKAFEMVKDELLVMNKLLVRNERIIIPAPCRLKAIAIAHKGHPGMTGTKKILRNSLWWPAMDSEVEAFVQRCETCFRIVVEHNTVPMERTVMPEEPMEAGAIDHFGPIVQWNNWHIVAYIDYHTRYMWASPVKSTDFASTKAFLESIFRTFGKPLRIRSDNGGAFREEYGRWCKKESIKVEHSIPYFPQQNGLIESSMKIVGKALKAAKQESTSFEKMLADAVIAHNAIRHPTNGMVPEEGMWGRKIRRALPVLEGARVEISREESRELDAANKLASKLREDAKRGAKISRIKPGDEVICKTLYTQKANAPYAGDRWRVAEQRNGKLILVDEEGGSKIKNVRDVKRQTEAMTQARAEKDDSTGTEKEGASTEDGSSGTLRRSSRVKKSTKDRAEFVYAIERCLFPWEDRGEAGAEGTDCKHTL